MEVWRKNGRYGRDGGVERVSTEKWRFGGRMEDMEGMEGLRG